MAMLGTHILGMACVTVVIVGFFLGIVLLTTPNLETILSDLSLSPSETIPVSSKKIAKSIVSVQVSSQRMNVRF